MSGNLDFLVDPCISMPSSSRCMAKSKGCACTMRIDVYIGDDDPGQAGLESEASPLLEKGCCDSLRGLHHTLREGVTDRWPLKSLSGAAPR